MANGNGGASSNGDLVLVSESSDLFHDSILGPLQNAYLYEESKQSFIYKSAFLIKNATLQEKYENFRVQRRDAGYSEKDLKESYGFLLFDDKNRANQLGETGVVTGNSTCTTLGDPLKGVYVSKYSDCLDINRWYHGKTGYIAIIKLTKGRVKNVLENYTQNLTAPSEGFDCHVSEQLAAVSANTSSFLAFERTQYYMYERLDVGSNTTVESPSHACPFAIVSFSYRDTKATPLVPQEKSEEKKAVLHYLPWRGQLQICSQLFNVGLKSTTGALMPAKLPAVVKVNRVVSMVDLRQCVPKAVFETWFSGEVSLDGMCCTLYELVPSEVEDTSLALLTQELMAKDLALAVQLNDGGFLIVLHSSHFLTYDDARSNTTEVLQGMFVFPDSRAIQRDTKVGQKKPTISSEILQVLPALNYAESEVEKGCTDQTGELCGIFEQHIQSYAALINPGLAASPSREASIFPDQYDVPDALKYLYSAPVWSSRTWQSLKSYQTQPGSFQLPVSRATELLEAGQEERRDDPDDEVYVFLSSPEGAPATPVTLCLEARLEAQESPTHADTSVDSHIASVGAQNEADIMPQNDVAHILQYGGSSIDMGLSKTELIVSITSAKETMTVLDRGHHIKSAVPVTRHCEVHLSSLSPTELQIPGVNSEKGEKAKKPIECSEISNTPKMDGRKRPRGRRKGIRISPKFSAQTSSLPEAKSLVDAENSLSENHEKASQPSDHPEMDNCSLSEDCDEAGHQEMDYSFLSEKCEKASQSSDDQEMNDKLDWRKLPRRRRKCAQLSSKCKRMLRSAGVKVKEKEPDTMQSVVVVEPEIHPLRKKTERWDLKPVTTECGRILVPHGSKNTIKHIVLLKDGPKATDWEHCPDKMMVEVSVEALETGQDSRPVLQMKHGQMATTDTMDGGGGVNSGQSKQSDGSDVSQTSKPDTKETSPDSCMTGADATDSHAPEPIQKQHTDGPIPVQDTKKTKLLLSKLRSLLPLRVKRKQFQDVPSDETQPGHAQSTELCVQGMEPSVKRSKADIVMEKLEMDLTEGDQDTTDVSKTRTLDPLLAQALCLTPKEFPDKTQKDPSRDIQARRDSSNVQHPVTPQTTSDKPAQPLQSTRSQISGRGGMKTLKKRQNVSRESIKKKWWLHFHTPGSFTGENPKSKVCTRNSSVRKNLKESLSVTFPPTDALTLLADLALCAINGQVPQQPDPAERERELDSSLETCDLTKDCLEPESVLHALLRQPTPSHVLTPKSPSPKGLVGNKEVVVLITKEHAYSLPPSSSLLLGLSGAPFQVSPLSGSAGLQHLRHNTNSDGTRALRANLSHEGKCQGSRSATESLSKDIVRRRRFRRSRTFIEEDGSVQITRLWKENYDFGLDSKFTNDPKDKTVTRALHGGWDFSHQDTTEQVQLIVHMWIGLFYSRSTARFFHLDSSLPCLEDVDCLEMSDGTVPKQTTPDPETTSSAPMPTKMPESKAVDLSKKKTPVLNQESVVLDLSLMKPKKLDLTSDTQVNGEELPVSHEQTETIKSSEELEPSLGRCESSTAYLLPAENQPSEICREKADVIDNICMLDDNRSSHESQNTSNLQKTSNLGHSAASLKTSDGTPSVLCEEMENVCIQQENILGTPDTVHVLERSNNRKTEMRDSNENPTTVEEEVVHAVGIDDSRVIVHEEMDSNCDSANLIATVECENNYMNDGDHVQPIDKPPQKDNVESSPPGMVVEDYTTNDETAAVHLLKNDTQPTMQAGEESKAFSLAQCEKLHEEENDHHPVKYSSILGDEAQIEMKDGADFKDQSPTVVHTGSHMSDKALPMLYGGHGSREDKLNAECTQVVNEKEACNTSLSEVQCANDTDDQTMPAQDDQTMPAQDYNSPLETLATKHGGDVSVDESPEVDVDESLEVDVDESPEVDVDESLEVDVDESPEVDVDESPEVDVDESPEVDEDEATSEMIDEATSVMIDEVTSEMIDEATSEMIDEVTSEMIEETTSEMIDEVTSEMIEETTSEMIDEVTSEMIDEVTSEMIEETTSEMIDEVTSEMIEEATSEMIDEATSEMIYEVTSEMIEEATSEMIDEVTSEMIEEATSEMIDEVTSEMIDEATSEMIYEATSEMIEEVTSEMIDEATSEMIDEVTSEMIEETTSEMIDEVTSEMIDEATSEMIEEVTSEMIEEATSEMIEEVTSEMIEEVTSEMIEEVTSEMIEEVTSEMIEEVTSEMIEEVTSEMIEEATSEMIEEVTSEMIEEVTSEMIDEVTSEMIDEVTSEMIEEVTSEMIEEATSEMIDEVTSEMIEEVTSEMIEEVTSEMIEEATSEMIEEATSEMIEEVTSEMIDEVTSEMIEEVTSEMIEEATSEMIEEVTSEMIEEATSEMIEEVTSEMIEEATSEMIEEVTSEMIEEATSEMIEEVTSEMIEEATSEMIEEVTSEIDEATSEATSEMIEEVTSEMIEEVTSEMIDDNHSRDEVLTKKAAYLVCAENAHTSDESTRAILQSVDDIVGESQNEVKSDLNVLSSSNSEDKDTRLIESEREVDNHASEITYTNKQWQPSQGRTLETLKGQIEILLIGEGDVGQDIASAQISLPKDELSERMYIQVEIPLIGIDAPWQETVHAQVSQDNTQEVVQGQKEIQLIRKSDDSACIKHTEPVYTSQDNSEKAPLFAGFVHSVSNKKAVSNEGKSENGCPTPTVDEKPYDDIPCPDQFSTSASGGNNGVCKIFTGKLLSRSSTPTQDEWPLDQESNDSCTLNNALLPEPRVNNPLNLRYKLALSKEQVIPDHELRTISGFSPIERQPCKLSHINESSHMETTEMHIDQEQALNSTAYSNGGNVHDHSCVASTSTKHQLHTKPAHNTLKSSLEETAQPTIEHYLSSRDGLKDTSLEQDSSHSYESLFSTVDYVQAVINQARGRATTQDNIPCEIRSLSQRPVMAVRPSKSDESQADNVSKKGQGYSSVNSAEPSDKPTQVTVHTHTTLSAAILSRHTDGSSAVSEDLNENEQEDTELCSKTNWVSDDQDVIRRFNLNKAKLDLIDALYPYQETDEQKFEKISNFYKIGQTAEGQVEIIEVDAQVATSAVVLDCKEKIKINDVGPSTSSIKRTVYNSSNKGSNSLVDQLSERCSESDLTLSSMEHESLIFSERMNQLIKRNNRGTSYSKTNNHSRPKHCGSEAASCPNPVTVCFSSLQEQEDSADHWEALPSLVGQKIKVNMPERGLADTTGGEKTLHLHRLSCEKGNPVAHAVVSDMTAMCARSYRSMMEDICASKKLSSKTECSKMESSLSTVESSSHADFCGQMKKEMYDSLHSNLNSVVSQSCRSKFRFYILVTSADAFFEETKELLKAEGHTEVQPSQFFLVEESSSPLVIILRNEDIAEHICEVPHLLELKKSPDVLFAGIDQPDDVVSLTHQELFSRGGFVVFEGAALETLSLCNMKKFSQFLEELSKNGKWKWLLHYRDSRQLKENARFTAEAIEKKRFIDCCQEAGMVEVLPYHECDIMSRDRPNYSSCLARLQVQNISARFPVFVTDTTADSAFGKNGILTMNINSFLLISQSDACTIS